jgi:hypothetical protein
MQWDFGEIWDKFWRDDKGRIVIWQTPNASLIGWAVLTVISLFFNGTLADVFSWLGNAALIVWCVLEVFRGVNYFRRLLGVLVFIFVVMSIVNLVK